MERRRSRLSRRQFVVGAAGLGLVAGCGRLPWQAESPARAVRIGFLTPSLPEYSPWVGVFEQALRNAGYTPGENTLIEYRYGGSGAEQLLDQAAELASLKLQLIVAVSTPAALAVKQATGTTPIVFFNVGDPVGVGLVASLGRPGGNATGPSAFSSQVAAKRLELLKETAPHLRRVAVLWNPANPANVQEWEETQTAAEALGLVVGSWEVRGPDDVENILDTIAEGGTQALFPLSGPIAPEKRGALLTFASEHRMPAMYPSKDYVESGGLMAYGPDIRATIRRVAYYVDRILRGTPPADLPVEQPMTIDFVVNMKTARELGITFPQEILLQITEVIDP